MKTIIEQICASCPTLANGPVNFPADELLGRAASLALQLRRCGAARGEIVTLLSSRCCEDIIGVLGILWSGAAFAVVEPVPFGVAQARLQQLGSRFIVSAPDSLATALSLAEADKRQVIEVPVSVAHSLPEIVSGQSDPAYVVFTSGSSGRPKPILVTHSNLQAYCSAIVERLGGPAVFRGKAAALVSSLSVDLGYTMVFPGLINGACLHVPPASVCVNAEDFAVYNKSYPIDLLKITPFHLRNLLQRPEVLPREVLVLGGEHFDLPLLAALKKHRPTLRVFNHYGPAETCIGVAAHQVDHFDPAVLESNGLSSVPVGPPLPEVLLRVVDASGAELPPGIPGELIVFGPTVSLGYMGMEAETKARFRSMPEGICYHTGDCALRQTDGSYVILGRLDRQLKIRGYRVDPTGVEAVLRSCLGVQEAAVGLCQLGECASSLVAWIIPTPECSEATVMSELRRRLAPIECPAVLITVDSFPWTPSGKIDFNRLPLPERSRPPFDTSNRLGLLLAVMTEVMGIHVNANANFLDIGGHSLAALRVIERLRAHGITVSLQDLYAAQNMEVLEARLTEPRQVQHPTRQLAPASERKATPCEEALWVASALSSEGTYHLPVLMEFRGQIDTPAIQEAIANVLERHGAFGLRVIENDGLRIEYGRARPEIERIPIMQRDGVDNAESRAWAVVRQLWAKPLAPENGQAVRAAWMQFEDDRAWFVLIAHHIVMDGPSVKIVQDEIAALLEGTALEPIGLVDPNSALTHEEMDDHVPAWLDLPLPTRGLASTASAEPRLVSRSISSSVPRLVTKLARDLRVTEFSVILTAWGIVVSRARRSTRVAVATPSDLRNHQEERTIGYKVNPIAVVINCDPDAPAAAVVKAVHESLVTELSGRQTPYAHHVQSRRSRGFSSSSVTAMIGFERWSSRTVRGCSIRRLPVPFPTVMFDLDVDIIEDDDGSWLIQLHGRGLGTEELAGCIEQFTWTLEEIARYPGRILGPLVSWLEDQNAVPQSASGAELTHRNERLHTRLVSRMEAEPEAMRLIINDEYFSLKRLDLRSRQWLTLIRKAGINAGTVIALDLEQGFDQIAAMLAISRHGSVILALDCMWPLMRKHAISARAAAVLTESRDYPNGISIDAETPPAAGHVDYPCSANDSAYIIGTSGSNGRPKLIQVSHGAIGNHFGWMRRIRPLYPGDRVLVWTTACFDVGMWERFAPLGEGATVTIASGLGARDLVRIAEIIVCNRITLFQTTPTLLRALLDNPVLHQVSWLIDVFCGGEFLNDELIACFRRNLPGCRLHNVYGPTETAIDALAAFDVHRNGCETFDHIVDNLTIRVVSEAGQALGVGQVGELAISGPSLADGYVGDAEASAASFHAINGDESARFYFTGDLACWQAPGKLKLMGRADRQVKLQGERFELEEIENALLNSGKVREAAVVQHNHHLAAFVVPSTSSVTPAELKTDLGRLIPRTFIPREWFLTDGIPRTTSGKINRKLLPQTKPSQSTGSHPMTPVQAEVAAVWRKVLGHDCGTEQNFFDAGGSSLLLLRLCARLKEDLGATFTIPELFQLTTIQAQAARLERTSLGSTACPVIPPDLMESGHDRHERIAQLAAQRKS